jgi:hypothetical protein
MNRLCYVLFFMAFAKMGFGQESIDIATKDAAWRKQYKKVGKFSEGLAYVVDEKLKMGFVNEQGILVIPMVYQMLSYFDEFFNNFSNGQALIANEKYLYGSINAKGDTVVPFIYKQLEVWSKTPCILGIQYNYQGFYGAINCKGDTIIPMDYEQLTRIENTTNFIAQKDEKKGIITQNNKILLPFESQDIFVMANNKVRVVKNNRQGILDEQANIKIPIEYEELYFSLESQYIIAKKAEKYGLIDHNNKTHLAFDYAMLTRMDKGQFVAQKKDKVGVIDSLGKTIIPFDYTHIAQQYQNLLYANKDQKKYLIFSKKKIFEIKHYDIDMLKEGTAWVGICLPNGKCGFLDLNGNEVIPFEYQSYHDFDKNTAAILRKNNKFGLIDSQNGMLLPFIYDSLSNIYVIKNYQKYYYARKDGKVGFIDKNEKTILSFEQEEIRFHNSYSIIDSSFYFLKDGKWGLRTLNQIEIPAIYDDLNSFYVEKKKYFVAVKEGKKGIVNFDGTIVIPCEYDKFSIVQWRSQYDFRNIDSFFIAFKNNKKGVISAKNEIIIPFEFAEEDVFYFYHNVVYINKNNKIGAYDLKGNLLFPFEYENQDNFRNIEINILKKEDKMVLIDFKNGKILSEPYQYIYVISGLSESKTISALVHDNGKMGSLDKNFKLSIPIEYDELSFGASNNENHLKAKKNGKYGIIDSKNNVILPCVYERLEFYKDKFLATKDGMMGVITIDGKTIIPFNYLNILWQANGNYIASIKNGVEKSYSGRESPIPIYGIIDSLGKEIIPFQYKNINTSYTGFFMGYKDNKACIWNKKLQEILPLEYNRIDVTQTKILATKRGKVTVFNLEGKIIIPGIYEALVENPDTTILKAKKDGFWGIISQKNEVLISFKYDEIGYQAEFGNWIVQKNQKYGIVTNKGKIVIPLKYEALEYSNDKNFIVATLGKLKGLINEKDSVLFPFEYQEIKIHSKYINKKGIDIVKNGKKGLLKWDGSESYEADALMDKYGVYDYTLGNAISDSIFCVSRNNKYGFVTAKGTVLTPLKYSKVSGNVINNSMLVYQGDKEGLVVMGKEVIACAHEKILSFSNEGRYAVLKKGKKFGAISFDNKIVVPFDFDYVDIGIGNAAIVKKGMNFGIMTTKGKVILPIAYDEITASENVYILIKKDKFGLANSDGKIILNTDNEEITNFENGVAAILKEKKWHYINSDGKVVSDAFDLIQPLGEGIDRIVKDGSVSYIQKAQKNIIPSKTQPISLDKNYALNHVSNGKAVVTIRGKKGVIDKAENIIIPFKYDDINIAKNDLFCVGLNGKWGVIDKNENTIIPFQYEYIVFENDNWKVKNEKNKYGIIDIHNKIIVPMKYDMLEMYNAQKTYWIFTKNIVGNQIKGIINLKGKELFSDTLYNIEPLCHNLFRVQKKDYDNELYYIDEKGKKLKPQFVGVSKAYAGYRILVDTLEKYYWASEDLSEIKLLNYQIIDERNEYSRLSDGLIPFVASFDRYGRSYIYANKDLEIKLKLPDYRAITNFHQGMAAVLKGTKWGYINVNGEEVIPFDFDEAEGFTDDGITCVRIQNQRGFIDKQGKVVIPFIFTLCNYYEKGVYSVYRDNKRYFIDASGKPLFQQKGIHW